MKTSHHIKYNKDFIVTEFIEKNSDGLILRMERYNDAGQLVYSRNYIDDYWFELTYNDLGQFIEYRNSIKEFTLIEYHDNTPLPIGFRIDIHHFGDLDIKLTHRIKSETHYRYPWGVKKQYSVGTENYLEYDYDGYLTLTIINGGWCRYKYYSADRKIYVMYNGNGYIELTNRRSTVQLHQEVTKDYVVIHGYNED